MTTLRNLAIVFSLFAALAFSGSARTDGIMSGPCIGCGEGIINVRKASCPSTPTVTALSPSSGTTAGGTSVTVTGTNFTGASAVSFGSTPAASFSVGGPTSITATSPAASAGTVDVRVTQCAQSPINQPGDQYTFTTPPSYTGPGDINGAAVVWGGLRGFSASYASPGTNPAIDLVDQTTSNPITINILSNGNLDIATINTWVAAHSVTTILVAKLYDQTGNGNHFVAFGGNPSLVLNSIGALPGIHFSKTVNNEIITGSTITQAQPLTMSAVGGRYAALGTIGQENLFGGPVSLLFNSSANTISLFAGSVSAGATASDNANHAFQAIFNGASSSIVVDGTSATVNPSTGGISSSAIAFGQNIGANPFGGHVYEGGLWAGDKSANNTTMCHNQFTYWGTATSC